MKYENTCEGRFIDRPNRFIAHVEVNGVIETVHVKNTGRCRELLIPGCKVILSISDNPNRKTKYDLIVVYKEGLGWVNIDSQVPNTVVKEWLESGKSPFNNITFLKPEFTYGKSRVDFYLEYSGDNTPQANEICSNNSSPRSNEIYSNGSSPRSNEIYSNGSSPRSNEIHGNAASVHKVFIEVKGCTLEINGEGYFPDAPTERGVKHLRELAKAVKEGYECYIAFVIAMPKVNVVHPNIATHPEFGTALDEAVAAGVKVLYLPCLVTTDSIDII